MNISTGLFSTLIAVLLASVRDVEFSQILRQVNIFVVIAVTFSITALFFGIFEVTKRKDFFQLIKTNRKDILLVNITTALMWFSFIFALKLLEPAVVTSLVCSIGPVGTVFLSFWLLPNQRLLRSDLVSAFGVMVSVVILISFILQGLTGDNRFDVQTQILGALAAVFSGLTTALNSVITKRLSSNGLKASTLMAVRFPLLILIAAISLGSIGASVSTQIQWLPIILITIFGTILPLYLLQVGIATSDINSVALLLALGPLTTFAIQILTHQSKLSYYSLSGILLAVSFVVWGIRAKWKSQSVA